MTRALLYKEFRESLPIALAGLAWLLYVALDAMGYSPFPGLLSYRGNGVIPFIPYGETFGRNINLAAGALALALGFWHSLGDFWGEAHLFLLHRPVSRQRVYLTKLAVGLGVYLLCGIATILLYATWAATPGTHASPFAWSMTFPTWSSWLAAFTLYLGAFLAGIRPAAWLGTRLAPLAAAAAVVAICVPIAVLPAPFALLLTPLVLIGANLGFLASILITANTRDFA